jgi:hypothetical protein
MSKKREEIPYHYRGLIERGSRYQMREGYSRQGIMGALYPWCTRGEARRDAIELGGKAVFYRNGKREERKRRPRMVTP